MNFKSSEPEEWYAYDLDRIPNKEEFDDLPDSQPSLRGGGKYEDEFSVDAILTQREGNEEGIFYAKIQRWVFKIN